MCVYVWGGGGCNRTFLKPCELTEVFPKAHIFFNDAAEVCTCKVRAHSSENVRIELETAAVFI